MGFLKKLFGVSDNQHAAEIAKRVNWLNQKQSSNSSSSGNFSSSSAINDKEMARCEDRAKAECEKRHIRAAEKRAAAEEGLKAGKIDKKTARQMNNWAEAEDRYADDFGRHPEWFRDKER